MECLFMITIALAHTLSFKRNEVFVLAVANTDSIPGNPYDLLNTTWTWSLRAKLGINTENSWLWPELKYNNKKERREKILLKF